MRLLSNCKFDHYVLVITGFKYTNDSSGTSKVVKAQEEIIIKNSIDYIAINPIKIKNIQTDCYETIVNGISEGVYTTSELIEIFKKMYESKKKIVGIIIHHLLNNSTQNVKEILEFFVKVPTIIYIHDFYTCCQCVNLLKNDKYFCAENGCDCKGCKYSIKQKEHVNNMKNLFKLKKDNLFFIAPSEFAKNTWLKFYQEYEKNIYVYPHLIPKGLYQGNKKIIDISDIIKVAYVGAQDIRKGWDKYKQIARSIQNNKYRYYYFGRDKEKVNNITNIDVRIHLQGKNAMIDALRNKEIDIVIMPTICPETYSYTLYESLAANCFIITTKCSGNIASVMEKEKKELCFKI